MDAPTLIQRTMEETGLDYDHAERVLRVFLVNFATQLSPGEADDLACDLPEPFAACVRHELEPQRLWHDELVRRLVHTVPLSSDQARYVADTLYDVLAEAVGREYAQAAGS